jgi:fatty acid desaturase
MIHRFDKVSGSQGGLGHKQELSEKQELTPAIAKKLRADLQQFTGKSDIYGFWQVASDYLILIGVSVMMFYGYNSPLPYVLKYSIIAFGMLLNSAALKALNNLVHQACHYTLYKTKNWNNNLQFLIGYLIFRDVESYRTFHSLHHKYLNTDLDPENAYRTRWLLGQFKSKFWTIVLIRPLLLYYTYDFIKFSVIPFWTNGIRIYEKLAFWYVIFLTVYFTNTWLLFSLVYLLPVFIVYPLITAFVEASEHTGLDGKAVDLDGGRNRNYSWFVNFILHRHLEGNHGLHHWYASIPDRYLNLAFAFLKKHYPQVYVVESNSLSETLQQMLDSE